MPLTPEDDEGKEIVPSNVAIVSAAPENSGSISDVFDEGTLHENYFCTHKLPGFLTPSLHVYFRT